MKPVSCLNGETLEPSTTTQRAHLEPRNVPLLRAGVPHISLSSQIALRSISPLFLPPLFLFSPSDEKIPSSWSFLYSPGARATIRRIAPAVGTSASVLWARYAQGGPFDPQLKSYTASTVSTNLHLFPKGCQMGVSFRPRANGLPCTASLIPINEFSIPLTITCCCLSLRLVDGCRSVGARVSGGLAGWLGWGEGRREKLSLAPATQKVF